MDGPWDVVVVGAGPAGSAAAYHAARAGHRVMLLDRAAFPRPKTCGDGLTPRALRQLEAMGFRPGRDAPRIAMLEVVDRERGDIHRGDVPSQEDRGDRLGQGEGTVILRTVLDDALRRAAIEAGAAFRGQCDVRAFTGAGRWVTGIEATTPDGHLVVDARVVLVAEGAAGRLRRMVSDSGRSERTAVAVRQYVRVGADLPATFRVYVPLCIEGEPVFGYGWVFPVTARLANVGVGWFLPPARVPRHALRRLHADFLTQLAAGEPAFASMEACGRLQGGLVPTGSALDVDTVPGVLLIGDAGRMANPFTGEGIAQALDSGRLAAEAVEDHLVRARHLPTAFRERMRATYPHRGAWAANLPWLAERGRIRAAEFAEMMANPTGVVGRAARRMALEEPAGHHASAAGDARASQTWADVRTLLAQRHPLLAELVDNLRRDGDLGLDAVLAAFRDEHPAATPAGSVMVGLSVAIAVLAAEVAPDTAPAVTAAWRRNALAIGAADLVVAEAFALLATMPAPDARVFCAGLERLVSELAAGVPPAPALHDYARTVGREEARCASG